MTDVSPPSPQPLPPGAIEVYVYTDGNGNGTTQIGMARSLIASVTDRQNQVADGVALSDAPITLLEASGLAADATVILRLVPVVDPSSDKDDPLPSAP